MSMNTIWAYRVFNPGLAADDPDYSADLTVYTAYAELDYAKASAEQDMVQQVTEEIELEMTQAADLIDAKKVRGLKKLKARLEKGVRWSLQKREPGLVEYTFEFSLNEDVYTVYPMALIR